GARVSRGDRWLMVLPLILTAFGVIVVYSSSTILGSTRFQDPHYYLLRQLFRAGLGLVVLVACARIDMRWLERLAPVMLGGAVGMLLLVLVVGKMSNGATRWLQVGFLTLQPT